MLRKAAFGVAHPSFAGPLRGVGKGLRRPSSAGQGRGGMVDVMGFEQPHTKNRSREAGGDPQRRDHKAGAGEAV